MGHGLELPLRRERKCRFATGVQQVSSSPAATHDALCIAFLIFDSTVRCMHSTMHIPFALQTMGWLRMAAEWQQRCGYIGVARVDNQLLDCIDRALCVFAMPLGHAAHAVDMAL